MEKHRGAPCQRKYYSSPVIEVWKLCKAVMEMGRAALWQLLSEMPCTHGTVKVHYLFPHGPFNSSKSRTTAVLQKYIQKVRLICVHLSIHFSVFLLNTTSLFHCTFVHPHFLSDLSATSRSHSLKHGGTEHTENISTQREKGEI